MGVGDERRNVIVDVSVGLVVGVVLGVVGDAILEFYFTDWARGPPFVASNVAVRGFGWSGRFDLSRLGGSSDHLPPEIRPHGSGVGFEVGRFILREASKGT